MKIALLGYGKMGKSIESIAKDRGHSIGLKISDATDSFDDLKHCDVAIDFSIPKAAVSNIKHAINTNVPVISGTTGWLKEYDSIVDFCKSKNGAFLYASNFSLGVNILFEVNKVLSQLISNFPEYKVSIEEIHHTEKLDTPSGTAITLADEIIKNSIYNNWTLEHPQTDQIGITAKRIENVPGTHEISYDSEIDTITIKHTAKSRIGFALGAVIAAEWIVNKKGIYSMKDVLNIG